MAARNYSNVGSDAELTALIGAADSTATLTTYTGFPSPSYTAAIDPDTADEEIVLVTNVVGSTVTITRGYDGTTAKTHAAGAEFRHVAVAKDFQEANDHIQATSGVHGLTGSPVGTTDTQVLSNKTLNSPTINGATFTGTTTFVGAAFSGTVTIAIGSITTFTAGTAAISGTLDVDGVTTLADVTAEDITATTVATSGAVTVGGTLGVTGALTGSSATLTGALTASSVDSDLGILDEVEFVQKSSDLTAASGRSSLFARTDGGLYFTPNGQTRRRAAMHWGSGSTLPSTGVIAGDTFVHTGLANSMLRYNGNNWRQIDGPVDIANMAARPTHANLHVGFSVFSLADDDAYVYDGVMWRNAAAGTFVPTGAGAGDYVTGVYGSTTGTTNANAQLSISIGRTFASSDYYLSVLTADGSNAGGSVTHVYPVSRGTSTFTVGARDFVDATVVSASIKAAWHVIGYND